MERVRPPGERSLDWPGLRSQSSRVIPGAWHPRARRTRQSKSVLIHVCSLEGASADPERQGVTYPRDPGLKWTSANLVQFLKFCRSHLGSLGPANETSVILSSYSFKFRAKAGEVGMVMSGDGDVFLLHPHSSSLRCLFFQCDYRLLLMP